MHAIRSCLAAVLGLAAAHAAPAADVPPTDPDAAALQLADQTPTEAAVASPWRIYAELAGGRDGWRDAPSDSFGRAALDLRYDRRVGSGLRAVLSDRLDLVQRGQPATGQNRNSLREAYLSWQPVAEQLVDVGRVNLRQGVAWGYNPTDYFKGGALRVHLSPDPATLRENRLGTVVLRGQQLWDAGSLSLALSPHLADAPSDDPASLDLGATNARNRWLLAGSRKLGGLNPQLLLHGGEDTPTQLGVNLSGLLSDSIVVFGELSVGDGPSFAMQADGAPAPEATRTRAALGLTFTTGFNLSLTAELEHNDAAPDRAQWQALAPAARLRLLAGAQDAQELPVRDAAFLYATWKDAGVKRLDLSAFMRWEPLTRSRNTWLEGRYRFDHLDVALQWQQFAGDPGSVFGTAPLARTWELSGRWYF